MPRARITCHADQRALGMSMRVKRATLGDVQARLVANKRRQEEAKAQGHGVEYDMDAKIAKMQDQDAKRKVRDGARSLSLGRSALALGCVYGSGLGRPRVGPSPPPPNQLLTVLPLCGMV